MVTASLQASAACCSKRNQTRSRRRQMQRAAAGKQLVCQPRVDSYTAMQACNSVPQVVKEVHPQSDVSLGGGSFAYYQAETPEQSIASLDFKKDMHEDRVQRRVNFSAMCEVMEITPYSEIYGIHPREFVFDKFYFLLPVDGVTDVGAAWKRRNSIPEEDSDSDSDDGDLLSDEWEYEYTM